MSQYEGILTIAFLLSVIVLWWRIEQLEATATKVSEHTHDVEKKLRTHIAELEARERYSSRKA